MYLLAFLTNAMRAYRYGVKLLSRFSLALVAILTTGCGDDVHPAGKRPVTQALDQTGVAVGQENIPHASTPARPAAKQSGSILDKHTSDVRNANVEIKQADAKAIKPRITAKDYVSLQGNAYVTIIGQTAALRMQQAIDLYNAENDRYPKDYDEFMAMIIKANGIALPQLPPYQKYGYDEKEHKLVILESQALNDQPALP
jgi:hypothetical protein